MAVIFSKGDYATETILFGQELRKLNPETGGEEKEKISISLSADKEFSKDLIDFVFHVLDIAIVSISCILSFSLNYTVTVTS